MKITLINEPTPGLTATQQVLVNRGVDIDKIYHYLNTSDYDINPPEALGEKALKEAARQLFIAVQNDLKVLVIVDSDCDGFTSAAVLINYLYDLFPAFVINNVTWVLHQGKQHGIDTKEFDLESFALAGYKLIICPDSSSNDYEQHEWLQKNGISTIVLDHHEADELSECACVINNQMCDYPNKELSGVVFYTLKHSGGIVG